MGKFWEMAVQQVGQTVAQKVSQNPQAAIATGLATAKTVGAAVVAATPYVAAVAAGGGGLIGYEIGKGIEKLLGY